MNTPLVTSRNKKDSIIVTYSKELCDLPDKDLLAILEHEKKYLFFTMKNSVLHEVNKRAKNYLLSEWKKKSKDKKLSVDKLNEEREKFWKEFRKIK